MGSMVMGQLALSATEAAIRASATNLGSGVGGEGGAGGVVVWRGLG